jgi:hypothetical protein
VENTLTTLLWYYEQLRAEMLVLTITESSSNTTTITACGSYLWAANGQTYTTRGTYRGTTSGCVTEVLVLTITKSSSIITTIAADRFVPILDMYSFSAVLALKLWSHTLSDVCYVSFYFPLLLLKILAMLSEVARKKADEAKARGMWLYDPQYKFWYSPEEFKHIFHFANCPDDLLERLQMRNPVDSVEVGFRQLMEIQRRLHVFAKRVMDYYKKPLP